MRVRQGRAAAALLAALVAGCGAPLGRNYEYEEQVYLDVDGSATIIVDASLAAFVALRNLPLDLGPHARTSRDEIRKIFESGGCHVVSVGQPWRRSGRRFIQVRLQFDDVRAAAACKPLAWSNYAWGPAGHALHYLQTVGASDAGDPGVVNWDGSEIVAFKLHLPSRVLDHNVIRLDTGGRGDVERGNILTWEQRLADRRTGRPVVVDAMIEPKSILYRTLWLFAGAIGAAVFTVAALIWWTLRARRRRA